MDAMMPIPAINNGNKIGPIPPNGSENCSKALSLISFII